MYTEGGYVVLLHTLLFLMISSMIVVGLITPLVSSNEAVRGQMKSVQAFAVGNSALEEVVYRLKNELSLPATEELVLGGVSATIAVSGDSEEKTISIDTEQDDFYRNFEIRASVGAGVNFLYGLHAGKGGFMMSGGAHINGSVYANGSIIGSGGPYITGSAFVANKADPVLDTSNGSPLPPPSSVTFGATTNPLDFAQSFRVSTTTPVSSVRLYMKRTAIESMKDVNVYLVPDSGGKPSSTKLATASFDERQLTTSFNHIKVSFSTPVALNPGSTYWLVLDAIDKSWDASYVIGVNANGYANGAGRIGTWANGDGGTWSNTSPAGLDAYFEVYVGGETGRIDGVTVGSAGGDAWANEVRNSTIHGSLFCKGSFNTNKPCDTSRADPVEQPFPVTDGNIADWKAEAEAGGVTVGNVSYGGSDVATIGPQKIQGNLSVTSGADLDIAGTVWVTGNLTISGGAVVKLANSYGNNPGVMVVDGLTSLTGGGVAQGNGMPQSYILLVSTSNCYSQTCGSNNAITVTGGTSSVILNAQKGAVVFTGGAWANQVTAYEVVMSGGTYVTYVDGISGINFGSGPAASWTIDEWEEI